MPTEMKPRTRLHESIADGTTAVMPTLALHISDAEWRRMGHEHCIGRAFSEKEFSRFLAYSMIPREIFVTRYFTTQAKEANSIYQDIVSVENMNPVVSVESQLEVFRALVVAGHKNRGHR
ncbi:hypothetical protein [Ensifer sp. ENS04]|uniref:hypothetical protein n=1 Tax=Ensifer sp. ENS04 TaxID=2769281 RepID=UPI001FEE6055|nr:hypothetical protein [Ensifer sp. ENS04]